MVGHVLLFHPAIKKIKELIDNGYVGDLKYLYSNRLNLGVVRSNENVFWSLASHDISVFKYLIDLNPIVIDTIAPILNESHFSQPFYREGEILKARFSFKEMGSGKGALIKHAYFNVGGSMVLIDNLRQRFLSKSV